MRSAYSLFDELNKSSDHTLSSRTLHSLKDFYFGYQSGLQDGGVTMQGGEPPFSQFSGWLARRFGRSKPSLTGKWTRYDGGWWRIIEEQFGHGKSGFDAFFTLLSEFRQRPKVLACYSKHPIEMVNTDSLSKITRIEAFCFPPEQGCFLNVIHDDGRSRIEGFYSSLDQLKASAEKQFNVSLE